ncbi:hypothetical protein Hypma_016610 [Hypsizygus marmoreus]|uniref:Uncharacterized protein n=1 Tax=Hypsizygus marmoreus TaxID=39966 RepID=A0A369IXI7_HYPMA|nr:hypothetical protein Hypma_016610 [Hypsizygus marmoreus]
MDDNTDGAWLLMSMDQADNIIENRSGFEEGPIDPTSLPMERATPPCDAYEASEEGDEEIFEYLESYLLIDECRTDHFREHHRVAASERSTERTSHSDQLPIDYDEIRVESDQRRERTRSSHPTHSQPAVPEEGYIEEYESLSQPQNATAFAAHQRPSNIPTFIEEDLRTICSDFTAFPGNFPEHPSWAENRMDTDDEGWRSPRPNPDPNEEQVGHPHTFLSETSLVKFTPRLPLDAIRNL